MKRKYSIGIILLTFLLIYLIGGTSDPDTINTPGQVVQADELEGFYLYEVNGYVVVYLSDKKTPYEYTDILYEELPDLQKKEIKNGKYLKNTEELYGFLENYSS